MQSTEGVTYKCMYRLPSGKIIVRHLGQVIGSYAGERKAALALAAHLGSDVRDLKTRQPKRRRQAPTMASGVYLTASGKFEVRSDGQCQGRFDTAELATKSLAKIEGARPPASKKAGRVDLARKRFAAAKQTFKTWRPSDMQDLSAVRKEETLFCIAPGPLYVIAIIGKERAWRAAIVRLARELPTSKNVNLCALSGRIGSTDSKARAVRAAAAKVVHELLVNACNKMTERTKSEQAYYAKHVNRNVAHHAGWLPAMQRMGILAKTTARDERM